MNSVGDVDARPRDARRTPKHHLGVTAVYRGLSGFASAAISVAATKGWPDGQTLSRPASESMQCGLNNWRMPKPTSLSHRLPRPAPSTVGHLEFGLAFSLPDRLVFCLCASPNSGLIDVQPNDSGDRDRNRAS